MLGKILDKKEVAQGNIQETFQLNEFVSFKSGVISENIKIENFTGY